MQNITYVFLGDRKKNFVNECIQSFDFYYGVQFFNTDKYELNIIEFNKGKSKFLNLIQKIEYYFSKLIGLPINFSKIINFKNFKIINNSDHVFYISESTGLSALPLIICSKFFYKQNTKHSLFVMGLFSEKKVYFGFKLVNKFLKKLLILNFDNLLFLGKNEYNFVIDKYSSLNKFKFLPFCLDTDFWAKKYKINKQNQILFVGNDSNRDISLLSNIVKNTPNINFKIISTLTEVKKIKYSNTEVINGSWGSKFLSDEELRDIYKSSLLTIIPLVDSLQPSGQSVALQSILCGTPVIISKTKGFWDLDLFQDNRNILFVEGSDLKRWLSVINKAVSDKERLKLLSFNGLNTASKNYNLQILKKELYKLIN